jgi:Tol biopolymer transport system component
MALTRDGTFITFVSRRDKLDQLEMIAVSGGPAAVVTRSELRSYISAPSWSFDGRSIIFSKHSNVREISMIDNFK